jgi:hypothetical protein
MCLEPCPAVVSGEQSRYELAYILEEITVSPVAYHICPSAVILRRAWQYLDIEARSVKTCMFNSTIPLLWFSSACHWRENRGVELETLPCPSAKQTRAQGPTVAARFQCTVVLAFVNIVHAL